MAFHSPPSSSIPLSNPSPPETQELPSFFRSWGSCNVGIDDAARQSAWLFSCPRYMCTIYTHLLRIRNIWLGIFPCANFALTVHICMCVCLCIKLLKTNGVWKCELRVLVSPSHPCADVCVCIWKLLVHLHGPRKRASCLAWLSMELVLYCLLCWESSAFLIRQPENWISFYHIDFYLCWTITIT